MIDGSYGSKYDKGEVGFKIGKIHSKTYNHPGGLVSIGISTIFVDETPINFSDYPCPHSYKIVKNYANQNQMELFLKCFQKKCGESL